MRTLSIKLPKTLEAKLAAAARRKATSKSVVVREALEAFLSQNGGPAPTSFAALAKDFIGCVDGGPRDLSYGKKHMRGFGK